VIQNIIELDNYGKGKKNKTVVVGSLQVKINATRENRGAAQ
jgi:hypothetical protein